MKTWVIAAFLFWNLAVFITYALDKYKATHQLWRIPEKVLLLMSLCAGGLGAILAGKLVHHKTRKWYFWAAWLLGLVIDAGLIYFIIITKF